MAQALLKSLWAQVLGGQAFGLHLKLRPPETRAPPPPRGPRDPFPQVSRCRTASHTARRAAGPAPDPRSCSAGEGRRGWQRRAHRRRAHRRRAQGACCWASAWSGGCRGTASSLREEEGEVIRAPLPFWTVEAPNEAVIRKRCSKQR